MLIAEVIIYVITFLIGSIGSTLAIINAVKRRSAGNILIGVFLVAELFYCIFNMLLFFFMDDMTYRTALRLMIIASNVCYFVSVAVWLMYIELMEKKQRFQFNKRIVILIAAYAAAVETVVVFRWHMQFAETPADTLIFTSRIVMLLNMTFTLSVAAIAAVHFVKNCRREAQGIETKKVKILSAALSVYMILMTYWDVSSYSAGYTRVNVIIRLDPVVFLFLVVCFGIIGDFYRKYLKSDAVKYSGLENAELMEAAVFELLKERYHITKREKEIIDLIENGCSNAVIGQKLFITENTVKKHISNIFQKTNISGRYELLNLVSEVRQNVERSEKSR